MILRLFPLLYEAESNQDRTWALGARRFFALVWLHQVRKVNRSVHHVFPPTKTVTIPYTLYLLIGMFWGLIIKPKMTVKCFAIISRGEMGEVTKEYCQNTRHFQLLFWIAKKIAKFNLSLWHYSCTKQCWEGKREKWKDKLLSIRNLWT